MLSTLEALETPETPETLMSSPGRYLLGLFLVGVDLASWVCRDARAPADERAASSGGVLLLSSYIVDALGRSAWSAW